MVKTGLGLFVFGLRDLALLALHFKLEEFLLDSVHQHGGGACSKRCACPFQNAGIWPRVVAVLLHRSHQGRASLLATQSPCRGLLPRRYVNGADEQGCGKATQDPPPILLQWIGSVDRRTQPATRTIV